MAGAAVALPPDARGADEVLAASSAILTDPAFATAAARLRDEIARMPPPSDLVPFLEEHRACVMVSNICTNRSRTC